MSAVLRTGDPAAIIRAEAALHDTALQAVIATAVGGEIVYWNRAAERLYGWKFDEVEGRHILDVTPSSPSKEQARMIMDALAAGRSWSGTFDVRSKFDVEFRVRVRDVPVRDGYGELIGVIGISSRWTELDAASGNDERKAIR